jgi:hypothetical protein
MIAFQSFVYHWLHSMAAGCRKTGAVRPADRFLTGIRDTPLLLPDAISEVNGHKGTQILQKSKTKTADNTVKCEEKCFWVDSPISAMLISPYSS